MEADRQAPHAAEDRDFNAVMEARDEWWRNHYKRLENALAEISRQVSWCNHGESDRGEALDKIDQIASDALRGVGPDA